MTPERFRTLKAALSRRQPDLTVLADDVHKPHNIAALLRTCDSVGVFEIHVVGTDGGFRRAQHISGGTAPRVGARSHPALIPAIEDLKASGLSDSCSTFDSHFQRLSPGRLHAPHGPAAGLGTARRARRSGGAGGLRGQPAHAGPGHFPQRVRGGGTLSVRGGPAAGGRGTLRHLPPQSTHSSCGRSLNGATRTSRPAAGTGACPIRP